ncbi:MAG TPA: sorbosone dehydrogenase family protein [Alloacidobacterium sp.]|nr:sorbosone dehydrogenase family protein [Alloacidobacterium sp.]
MRRHSLCVAAVAATFAAIALSVSALHADGPPSSPVITGKTAFTDYSQEKPGVRRKITIADLPEPYATKGVDNGADMVKRPDGAWPQAPAGFKVSLYADGLVQPRLIRTAPNGDLFVAMSSSNEILVFRGVGADGKPKQMEKFADGLSQPFGIAFYPSGPNPKWVYIGNTDSVVRFPYKNGDLKASGPAEKLADLPGGGRLRGGGHWTRDIVFSQDGTKMFVSVGSHSNVDDPDTHPEEFHRADVLEFTPEGKFIKIYAYGIRNCVGEAINPITGQLWCSTNERDMLGDNLVPDYITHIEEDGFYGWPWWYMGPHQDPRLEGKHPELKAKVTTPDVLLQPHFASLEMNFYQGSQFPAQYKGDAFAAEHGSWNKANRAGYEVIRVPMNNGKATGEYEDFLTGFTTADGHVWGRPVGVTFGDDGSLFVTDDGSGSIWHVTYAGN